MKTYEFDIIETWSTTKTFQAKSEEEAYDLATDYQNEMDIDLATSDFVRGFVTLKGIKNENKT
jgi:hypothetical protein